jgi:CheY-like chemotaxis protein
MTRVSLVCVDDNPEDRLAVRLQIEDMFSNNPITYLSTGEELLQRLHEGRIVKPGIILIDLDLPGMSGYELVRTIRADHKDLDRTHLVVLSNDRRASSVETAFSLGATGYIKKPVTIFSFLDVINRLKPRRLHMEIHDRGVEQDVK